MSSGLNDFFIETAVNQGWLNAEQVAAAQQTLAADLSPFREGESATHLSICDFLLQQGWLGQEHVDWLQQASLLQTSSGRLKARAKDRDHNSSPLTPVSSAHLNAVLQAGLSAVPTAQAGLSAARLGMGRQMGRHRHRQAIKRRRRTTRWRRTA